MRLSRPAVAAVLLLIASGCTHTDDGDSSKSPFATAAAVTDAPSSDVASPLASAAASAAPSDLATGASPAASDAASPAVTGSPAAALSPAVAVSPTEAVSALPAVAFDDVAGSQHGAAISALGRLGVLDTTTGHFMPDAPAKRRDFVRWLFKTNNALFANSASHVFHSAAADDPSAFSDVAASDPDFPYVQGMNDAGVSVGFPDKTFKPDQPITREQALAIKSALDFGGINASYAKDATYSRYNLPQWKDRADVSNTFVAAVAQDIDQENDMGVNNIGRTFGAIVTFRPTKALTRGEAAEMLQIVGGHARNMVNDNAMRSVAGALHPTPAPT